MSSPLDRVREYEIPKVSDPRGNLSFIEEGRHVPFPVRRIFYIYDIPSGSTRGGHAHREQQQLVMCVSGAFELRLTDGDREITIPMNRPNKGIYVPPGVWLTMHDFTTASLCLVLCSGEYEESDYIRDLDEYLRFVAMLRHK